MNGALLVLLGCVGFTAAYLFYSRFIARTLGVDTTRPTPSKTMYDGVDYVPAHPAVLFGHHFATIAGAGPIIGPILAAQFGWLSVAFWVVLGCIFIGATHDMVTLFLSVRHRGESIGSIIEDVLGRRGKTIFLLFCLTTLLLVMAEFTRQVALTFVVNPGVATSSLLSIGEAILFGWCVYRLKLNVFWMSLLFVPLLFLLVWVGTLFPLDLMKSFSLTLGQAKNVWIILLFLYCYLASTLPVWLLLQPRDYLNSYLLYAMLVLGISGLFLFLPHLQIQAFSGFTVSLGKNVNHLFPMLFVTVACGACSGFHAMVASGTTSKQIANEGHIRLIGYGGMLLEGVVALLALVSVGYLSQDQLMADLVTKEPVQMFASGLGVFCTKLGFSRHAAESFMLLAVSAFLMTSVDSCTRLARFVWQELFSSESMPTAERVKKTPAAVPPYRRFFSNMYVATAVVVLIGVFLLIGNPKMAKNLWTMFASANQMLASLTLLTASLWLMKNHRNFWIVLLPMCFMLVTSGTAVINLILGNLDKWIKEGFSAGGGTTIAAVILFCLCIALLVLGGLSLRRIIRARIAQSIRRMAKDN